MKHLLLTTIAAVVLVGCGTSVDIHEAARDGNIEAAKQHLAAGTDVNAKEKYTWRTPLHYAANKKIAELLIANGADVNAKGWYGLTPLHKAASNGHKEIAEQLIAKGADVNAKGIDDQTPLHEAGFGDHKEIVELLITKGADVNATMNAKINEDRWTLLDEATHSGNSNASAITDLLRKHGGKTGEELPLVTLHEPPASLSSQSMPFSTVKSKAHIK